MKETKKQRKLRKGMNAATEQAFKRAPSRPPIFHNSESGETIKISVGIPHVNAANFGL